MEQILDRYRGSRVSATVSYTERKRIIENRPRFLVGDPLKNSIISVDSGASPELVYSHTHPSGNNGKYRWYQAPSKEDINNANGIGLSSYVFGMGNKTVYIYDKEGIRATLSLDIYKNYKVGGR